MFIKEKNITTVLSIRKYSTWRVYIIDYRETNIPTDNK